MPNGAAAMRGRSARAGPLISASVFSAPMTWSVAFPARSRLASVVLPWSTAKRTRSAAAAAAHVSAAWPQPSAPTVISTTGIPGCMMRNSRSGRPATVTTAPPSEGEEVPPLLQHLAAALRARLGDAGELVPPLPGSGGVDDRARVEAPLPGGDDRIERPAPAAPQDVDIPLRIAAGADRPHHVLQVHHIDVVVDDDHEAAEVRAGVALRGDDRGLLGVSGVPLPDRDHREQPGPPHLVTPDA